MSLEVSLEPRLRAVRCPICSSRHPVPPGIASLFPTPPQTEAAPPLERHRSQREQRHSYIPPYVSSPPERSKSFTSVPTPERRVYADYERALLDPHSERACGRARSDTGARALEPTNHTYPPKMRPKEIAYTPPCRPRLNFPRALAVVRIPPAHPSLDGRPQITRAIGPPPGEPNSLRRTQSLGTPFDFYGAEGWKARDISPGGILSSRSETRFKAAAPFADLGKFSAGTRSGPVRFGCCEKCQAGHNECCGPLASEALCGVPAARKD